MKNFITLEIDKDLEERRYSEVRTRFPPEPNGYLHLGHAKAACLNFGIAAQYMGKCHLRFDDTNPLTESPIYEKAIIEDLSWLLRFKPEVTYTSDYFPDLLTVARKMVECGDAYVCDLSPRDAADYRDSNKELKPSPYRDRTISENLARWDNMFKGIYKGGECTLRAKIDWKHPSALMRDPVMYRIIYTPHHRTGAEYCIYPSYDFSHPLVDYLERITHSLCTLEFEEHRQLYNWFLKHAEFDDAVYDTHYLPKQREFARCEVDGVVLSKRKLRKLVYDKRVDGWDDPRMPTLRGLRNRGYTPEMLQDFCEEIGVSKTHSVIAPNKLENIARDRYNKTSQRVMCVFDPLSVRISNLSSPAGEYVEIENNPEDPEAGTRKVLVDNFIMIEKDDFSGDPPPKFKRLKPGGKVRIKGAGILKHVGPFQVDEDLTGIECELLPEEKVKGTIHWVSVGARPVNIYQLGPLFDENGEFNEDSMKELPIAFMEPLDLQHGQIVQLMRKGYYKVCIVGTRIDLVEVVPLKDPWKKKQKKGSS